MAHLRGQLDQVLGTALIQGSLKGLSRHLRIPVEGWFLSTLDTAGEFFNSPAGTKAPSVTVSEKESAACAHAAPWPAVRVLRERQIPPVSVHAWLMSLHPLRPSRCAPRNTPGSIGC
jgi:hypothetical protein